MRESKDNAEARRTQRFADRWDASVFAVNRQGRWQLLPFRLQISRLPELS